MAFLTRGKHARPAELEELTRTIDAELESARTQALADPGPDPKTQALGVFAGDEPVHPAASTWFRGGPAMRPADQGRAP